MRDYFYPLPKHKLKKRFKRLFKVIKSRQSGSFIGLPESAKGGYFKFILENENLLKEFLGEKMERCKVLYFDPIPFITKNHYHWLFQLSTRLAIFDRNYKHIRTEDPIILLTNIQNYILRLSDKKQHICIVISKPRVWRELSSDIGYSLKAIWDVNRQPPLNPCSLIFFLHSQSPSFDRFPDFYNPVLIALNESVIYFPVLDYDETIYTINRFLHFGNSSLDLKSKDLLYELTGGYYPLIANSIKVLNSIKVSKLKSRRYIKSLVNNKVIVGEMRNFWNSLTEDQKRDLQIIAKGGKRENYFDTSMGNLGILDFEGKINSSWIKSFIRDKVYKLDRSDLRLNEKRYLRGKEYLVFRLFHRNLNSLISRDELADTIWGKEVKEKFSSWAIDKLISRIRKKLKDSHSTFSIITIKNKGYVMV